MSKYNVCTECGAHNDPGEKCDCTDKAEAMKPAGYEILTADKKTYKTKHPEFNGRQKTALCGRNF